MISAVRCIITTAFLLAINLFLAFGSQQDSLKGKVGNEQNKEAVHMLNPEHTHEANQLKELKEAENNFKTNNNNTSGIETFLDLGNYFLAESLPDSAFFYFKKAHDLSGLLNEQYYLARSFQEIGKYYLVLGDYSNARDNAQKALNVFSTMKDSFRIYQLTNLIGETEVLDGNIRKGKMQFDEVVENGNSPRDIDAIAYANFGLGKILLGKYKYEKAFERFKVSKKIWQELGNELNLIQAHNKLAIVYQAIGLDSLAFMNAKKAISLNTYGIPDALTESFLTLTCFYLKNNSLDDAERSVEKALTFAENESNNYLKAQIKKADILCRRKQFDDSKALIEVILPEAKENKTPGIKAEAYEVYSRVLLNTENIEGASLAAAKAYEAAESEGNTIQIQKNSLMLGQIMNERGQFISASRFLILSNQYSDSINALQSNTSLLNKINLFEGIGKTGTGKNKKGFLAGADRRVQNLLLISIILLVILITFFSALAYKGYRRKRELETGHKPQKNQAGNNTELEKLATLNNKIFSVISHDLRSPLISIKDSIDFLRHEELDEETKQETLVLSEELTEATLNLLDNLLGWAKNQKKQVDPKKVEVRILDEVKQIKYLYKASVIKKEISFTVDCADDVVALADNELINLALRNLVSNAVKFTPRGGNIHISGSTSGQNVIVSVKDTGVGISKEDQMKILSPDTFFTKNGTENESGSGIGLKLVNEFIKIMDGELIIESTQGQGSKFLFSLPAYIRKKKVIHEINTLDPARN